MRINERRQRVARVLGIDLGTREVGYAVSAGDDLVYFGVHTFSAPRTARRLVAESMKFVRSLVDAFGPGTLAIGETRYPKSRRPPVLDGVARAIIEQARKRGLRVRRYRPDAMKRAVVGRAATKLRMAEVLVGRYPYLEKFLRTDLRTHEKYWENMFEAVGLCVVASEANTPRRRAA